MRMVASGSADAPGLEFVLGRSRAEARRACLARARPGERWIDVGCGAGELTAELAREGLRVIGVDADPETIGRARRRTASLERLRWVVARAERLPLADGAADGVAAASLVGCLDDFAGFLREAGRVLRAGQPLVLTVTNRASMLLRASWALAGLERRVTGAPRDLRVYRLYPPREVLGLLRVSGFEPLAVRFYNYVLNLGPWLLPPAALASALGRRARPDRATSRLARNFVVVAARR